MSINSINRHLAAVVSATLASTSCDDASTTTDPVARHIAVIELRVAANNTGDWATWQSLHTDNAIRTAPDLAEPITSAAGMRAAIEVLANAMPDYTLELLQAFGEGDDLTVRFRATGTFTQPFVISDDVIIPPTGKSFTQEWVALVRFDGDKIAEFHEFADQYAQFVQLDVLQYFVQ